MDPTTRHDLPPAGEPSLGDLLRALAADASALIRQEMALAKAELKANVAGLVKDAGAVAVGGVLAAVGALVLLGALIGFLGHLMGGHYSLAALIVGLVLVGGGAFLSMSGMKKLGSEQVAPEQTLTTLRDTGDWARAEVAELKATLAGDPVGHGALSHDRMLASSTVTSTGATAETARHARTGTAADERQGRAKKPAAGAKGKADAADEELPVTAPLWKRVAHEFSRDDISNQAAKVAYYFFMSFPPAVMALFGLTGIFGGPKTADWLTAHLSSSLPSEAGAMVKGFMSDVVLKNAPGPLSIGLLLALWSGSNIFSALGDTLNQAYGVKPKRGFVKKKAVALGVMAGPVIAKALGLGDAGQTIWSILQWPLSFLLIVAAFWLIYYILPEKDQSGCKGTLFKSAAISTVIFLLVTLLFRLYISNFGSYSKTYGALGAVIVLLLWMYVTSMVILLGGEISSEMERSK
jgi:membrane protein